MCYHLLYFLFIIGVWEDWDGSEEDKVGDLLSLRSVEVTSVQVASAL